MASKLKAVSALSLLLLGQATATLQPIVMKGSKFFYENGTQFFIKGVAYQQDTSAAGATSGSSYTDPLADAEACKRDVPLLKQLGTNTIRVYAIDPSKDHKECMSLLEAAGIYVISDLSEPSASINRETPMWDTKLYKRYTSVVDEMMKYPGVIGFFAGNEVTNNKTNTPASAYVKAAVRDTKTYIARHANRWLGVGYAANDDADIRSNIAHYFNCGNQSQAIDFWGYNIYEWCGHSSLEKSGYKGQVDFFKNYSVPVFFAEYGCNLEGGQNRIFEETTALYSNDMTGVISGGIVYMYFQEDNDYGLVKVDGGKATKLKAFDALAKRVAEAKPQAASMDAYNPSNHANECPALSSNWAVKGETLPPTPDEQLCECMVKSVSCAPAKDLDEKDYGQVFGYICSNDPTACAGINGNTSTGVYGSYSMCDAKQKLAHVLDQYYTRQKKAAKACSFNGMATTVSGSVDSSCSAALTNANAANQVAATATSVPTGGSGKDKDSAAAPVSMFVLSVGNMAIGLYVVMAMAAGAGMMML